MFRRLEDYVTDERTDEVSVFMGNLYNFSYLKAKSEKEDFDRFFDLLKKSNFILLKKTYAVHLQHIRLGDARFISRMTASFQDSLQMLIGNFKLCTFACFLKMIHFLFLNFEAISKEEHFDWTEYSQEITVLAFCLVCLSGLGKTIYDTNMAVKNLGVLDELLVEKFE